MEEQQEETTEEVNQSENDTDINTEGETQEETETEGSTKSGESDEPDLTTEDGKRAYEKEIRKDQDKRWKDRIKKGEKGAEKKEVTEDDRYNRLDLKTEGITDTKEQDIVLDYAKYKKVSPIEAMKSPGVKAELAELRSKNVPAPSSRTSGGASDSFDYWKAQALKGNFPEDPKMRQKLRKARIFTQ